MKGVSGQGGLKQLWHTGDRIDFSLEFTILLRVRLLFFLCIRLCVWYWLHESTNKTLKHARNKQVKERGVYAHFRK